MAQLMEGRPIADKIKAELQAEVERLKEITGAVPNLVGILVGENKSSESYLRTKEKTAKSLGISSSIIRLPAEISPEELIARVKAFNEDDNIDGILIQLPLPPKFKTNQVMEAIAPDKDVDGLHPVNLGRILMNEEGLRPCTPAGIIELLKFNGVTIEGKEIVIIGRSLIVGKPLAVMLTNENGTVTLCHTRTRQLAQVAARADILVAAIGKPAFIQAGFVREGAVVVDVGINYVSDEVLVRELFGEDAKRAQDLREKGYTIVGDVDPRAADKASLITPVPGGVGLLTVAMLMRNTVTAFKRRRHLI